MERRQASKFYPHFNQEERPVIDYFTGLFNQLIFKHESILTDFLDPAKRDILRTIVGNDAFIQEYGGYPDAEKILKDIEDNEFSNNPQETITRAIQGLKRLEYSDSMIQNILDYQKNNPNPRDYKKYLANIKSFYLD